MLAALALLICGETVLKGRLSESGFVVYWLSCFVLTGLAVLSALLDLRSLQNRVRREQRALLETTLERIEDDAKARRSQGDANKVNESNKKSCG